MYDLYTIMHLLIFWSSYFIFSISVLSMVLHGYMIFYFSSSFKYFDVAWIYLFSLV